MPICLNEKNQQVDWWKQYIASRVKCNESNNTSVSNIERVEWKKWQSQTQEIFFEVRATCFMSPPSPREGFSLSIKDHTKELQWSTYDPEYTTPTSTQEVAQSQRSLQALGDHKNHKPSLYNFLEYRMRNKAQKVYVRENSVKRMNLRA